MWSEEELRDISAEQSPSPVRMSRFLSQARRVDVLSRNLVRANGFPHDLTRGDHPAVIYTPERTTHGNFYPASYKRILAKANWRARLDKAHTAKRENSWRELDTAVSSDALLMNIFCAPRVLAGSRLPALLNIDQNLTPIFGYRPSTPTAHSGPDPTEIDMKLGPLLVEAKLTEADFQSSPIRLLDRYPSFASVFHPQELPTRQGRILSYQLIRGVLAAHAEQAAFSVFCEARRPDLIEAWYTVIRAVRSAELRSRLRIHTWQEIAMTLPAPLQSFLREKYGI